MELYRRRVLGLGYNIDNEGGVLADGEGQAPDTLRVISQVRFGVEMTGETESGIVFGAEIWADDAVGGEGGEVGQVEGSVFVSGDWGTLTFGDTDAADQQWVGDVPGNFSLTGLTDITDTKFVSNGGSFGDDSGETFAENPFARPTVRYDFALEDLRRLGFDEPRPHRRRGRRRALDRPRRRQLEPRHRLLQLRRVRGCRGEEFDPSIDGDDLVPATPPEPWSPRASSGRWGWRGSMSASPSGSLTRT